MKQSPSWETNQFSASQEIPLILWNPKVHHHIHKCPPPVPVLRQISPVHTPTSHFLKICLNIILLYYAWFFHVVSFALVSPPKPCICCPHTCYMPRPSYSSQFYHLINTGWRVRLSKLVTMYFSPLPCYLIPLRPKYSPQQPILKHPHCELPSFMPIQNSRQNYSYNVLYTVKL